ncbi:MAG TPA: zf-HC2 domain-containing protein [Actinomycetota bacterium]|nr:zf-HC2 domain-containing protein [Actinomycetota bacterium]
MSEHVIESLSAYLDGELDGAERDVIEGHLSVCPDCAAALADLERIVGSARTLEERPPERDLWPGIASRLQPRQPVRTIAIQAARRRLGRRFSFTMSQLAAAAIALMIISAAAVWWVGPRPSGTVLEQPARSIGTIPPGPQGVPVSLEENPAYTDALADLERAFEASRDRLDPETVATVERNLSIIDEAIRQTIEALEADPGSTFLYDHLERSRRQKLDVLRQATLALQTT